jgi:uncharacterized membrane protein AbrB (regulator of aidB expression)
MLRRTTVASLWFVSIFVAHELAWSIAGSPRPLGLILGLIAATIVWIDPLRVFHPRSQGMGDRLMGGRIQSEVGPALR